MVAETERDAYAESGSEEEQQGLSEVAETARGKAASGAERIFTWLSPGSLTGRIVLINVIGLIILASGILYLNQFRQGLIDARVQAMSTQGQIIAAAIAASATVDTNSVIIDTDRLLAATERKTPNTEEYLRNFDFPINPERAAPVLDKLIQSTKTQARIFDNEGVLLVDSASLQAGGQILEFELPPLKVEEPGFFDRTWDGFKKWLFAPGYPLQQPYGIDNGKDFPEIKAALNGASVSVVRVNAKQEIVVSVAVPIQRFYAVQGALVLTTRGGEIDETLTNERWHIIRMFLVAAIVAVLLSLLLAGTIAEPIRRLAGAAETVRKGINKRVEIPDYSHRRDEIGHLSGAFRDMTNALYNRIDAIEAFAADVSHELKNPLTSLRSAVESLAYVKEPEQRERLTEIINDDVRRLDRLISDISDASRLDAEMAREEFKPVDVRDLVQTFATLANETRSDTDPEVTLRIDAFPDFMKARGGTNRVPEDAYFISGHDSRLGQVVHNLLGNARSFSPDNSKISVVLRRIVGQIEIIVEDQGPGIPEENLEKVFKRFYTDRPEAHFGKNSGLGLAISKQIVEAHRGRIWAENRLSTPGPDGEQRILGARFIIRLPAAGNPLSATRED
ncbi:MAG: stimulus-sensing domain-containing protein [Hyphomicrobiales bacterium]